MGEDEGTGGPAMTEAKDPEEIRSEIEETREQLGDTVEALARKSDVKAQAKQKLEDAKAAAAAKKEQVLGKAKEASPETAANAAAGVSQKARENPVPVAVAGAFAAGLLVGRMTKR